MTRTLRCLYVRSTVEPCGRLITLVVNDGVRRYFSPAQSQCLFINHKKSVKVNKYRKYINGSHNK